MDRLGFQNVPPFRLGAQRAPNYSCDKCKKPAVKMLCQEHADEEATNYFDEGFEQGRASFKAN